MQYRDSIQYRLEVLPHESSHNFSHNTQFLFTQQFKSYFNHFFYQNKMLQTDTSAYSQKLSKSQFLGEPVMGLDHSNFFPH